jgi:toxin ParE1/3/4
VARYRLSKRAVADIAEIAGYTIQKFGLAQARRYRDGLEATFFTLAELPPRMRSAEHLAPRLWRLNYKSHVIFFRADEEGALVVRVLHQRMAFERHPMTGSEMI